MIETPKQAVDEILALLKEKLDEEAPQVLVLWPNVRQEPPSDPDALGDPSEWARVTVEHIDGNQESLADHLGRVKFFKTGIVSISFFVPLGRGVSRATELANIGLTAYEGVRTSGGVWFRRVHLQEAGPSGSWFQVNVFATFEYSHRR